MAHNGRSEEQIRSELEAERQGLAGALADLREELRSARRLPALAGGALLAGLAAAAAVKAARRSRRERD